MYLPTTTDFLIAILVIAGSLFLSKLRQTTAQKKQSQTEEAQAKRPQTGTLREICSAKKEEFELIAVHGLAADPEWTWAQVVSPTDPNGHGENVINKDKHLLYGILRKKFPNARILNFADNSVHLGKESVLKTTQEIGRSLKTEVEAKRRRPHLPLIFMGHSMGGIVIKQALCTRGAEDILEDTCGIIFLGTPHQGSSLSWLGSIVSFFTKPLGSDMTLVLSLTKGNAGLSDLCRKFDDLILEQRRKPYIAAFRETKATFVGRFSAGVIVDRDSAVQHAQYEVTIDTDHSGLNKCFDADIGCLDKLVDHIDKARVPSRLEQVDNTLRGQYHGANPYEKLNIIRLSKKPLPMGSCFINLSIVEHHENIRTTQQDTAATSSFSVSYRKAVDDVDKNSLVDLAAIFDKRQRSGKTTDEPKRILIRGRAGVGKTTLCKKMVHDFLDRGMWKTLFARVLWIPLRNLKRQEGWGYNLQKLFYNEFFSHIPDGSRLADQLWDAVLYGPDKTLFILDGMDEVSELLGGHGDMGKFLDNLLRQDNVIITSRPSISLPSGIKVDLELETIGFSQEQVEAYLKADPKYIPRAEEIQSLLQRNWLLRSLVRIPIHLDALCFIWEDIDRNKVPETMTGIYSEIVQKLWTKDLVRIGKVSPGDAEPLETEIESEAEHEILLLEYLAFDGLRNDTIHFSKHDRDKALHLMMKRNPTYKLKSRVDDLLAKLSFMRSSDPSQPLNKQTFHFIHLTYQEYFAARWFKRCWEQHQPIYIHLPCDSTKTSADDLIRQHKYTARFNILWRFVSGLCDLDTYDTELIHNLFDQFGEEPIDLFGATHHRLLVHCLAEVVHSVHLRTSIEHQLSRWLEFECNIMDEPQSIREPEFPAGALDSVFQKVSIQRKQVIVDTLNRRRMTTPAVLELFSCWLRDPGASSELRLGMLKTLKHSVDSFSNSLMDAIASQLDNAIHANEYVKFEASEVLGMQNVFPDSTKNRLLSQLRSKDQNKRIQAVMALRSQSFIPQDILMWLDNDAEDVKLEGLEAIRLWTNLPPDLIPILVKLVGGEHSDNVRKAALERLSSQRDLPHDVLVKVATQLQDPDTDIKSRALECVGDRSNLSNHLLQAIVVFIGEKGNFELFSAWLYDGIDPRDGRSTDLLQRDVIEAAVERLGYCDQPCRQEAVKALKNLCPFPIDTCRAILRQLNAETMTNLVQDFGMFFYRENFPISAARTLIELAETGDEAIMEMAKTILWDLGPLSPQQLDVVIQWLGSADESTSKMASCIIGHHSEDSESFLRDMASGLENQTEEAKISILHRLTALAPNVSIQNDVVQCVASQLVPENQRIYEITLSTLHAFGRRSHLPDDIINQVANQLTIGGTTVKVKVMEVLLQHQKRFEEPFLREILLQLDDENDEVKEHALRLLSFERNDTLPPDFHPVIEKQIKQPGSFIKRHAMLALPPTYELSKSTLEYLEVQLKNSISRGYPTFLARERAPGVSPQILNRVTYKLRDRADTDMTRIAASALVSQKNLGPDTLLALAESLKCPEDTATESITEVLSSQAHLDDRILKKLIRVVTNSTGSRVYALSILKKHLPLSHKLIEDLADLINGYSWNLKEDVIDFLGSEPSLPEHILLKITATIGDVDLDVRRSAYNALRRQLVLPDTVLKSEEFYRLWLQVSFEDGVYCYIEDGITYLNMPFNSGKVQVNGNPNDLKIAIRRIQNKFGLYL